MSANKPKWTFIKSMYGNKIYTQIFSPENAEDEYVMFLHGILSSMQTFDPYFKYLINNNKKYIAFDMRGYRMSNTFNLTIFKQYGGANFTYTYIELLKILQDLGIIDKIKTIFCHSFGTMVSQAMLMIKPSNIEVPTLRCNNLIMINGSIKRPDAPSLPTPDTPQNTAKYTAGIISTLRTRLRNMVNLKPYDPNLMTNLDFSIQTSVNMAALNRHLDIAYTSELLKVVPDISSHIQRNVSKVADRIYNIYATDDELISQDTINQMNQIYTAKADEIGFEFKKIPLRGGHIQIYSTAAFSALKSSI